jgi:hypothetical protein
MGKISFHILPNVLKKNIKLWTESLNSDGYQFHQIQQNKQSPLISTELREQQQKNLRHVMLEIRMLV